MKISRCLFLPSCFLRCLAAALCVGGTAVLCFGAAPERFEKTKVHLDALLDRHRKAEPLPAKPANPFLFTPPGTVAAPSGPPTGPTATVEPTAAIMSDDNQVLAYCVSRLRISGQVLRGGVSHLMINSATYREGDLIPLRGTGDIVYYIKVVRVVATEVVFGYNDAVLTIPLKS